jgi:hypothetical protein
MRIPLRFPNNPTDYRNFSLVYQDQKPFRESPLQSAGFSPIGGAHSIGEDFEVWVSDFVLA